MDKPYPCKSYLISVKLVLGVEIGRLYIYVRPKNDFTKNIDPKMFEP